MKLSALTKGGHARILHLPDGDIRSQLIRLGLTDGAIVKCIERLPGGTLILGYRRQEMALSTELAHVISVEMV